MLILGVLPGRAVTTNRGQTDRFQHLKTRFLEVHCCERLPSLCANRANLKLQMQRAICLLLFQPHQPPTFRASLYKPLFSPCPSGFSVHSTFPPKTFGLPFILFLSLHHPLPLPTGATHLLSQPQRCNVMVHFSVDPACYHTSLHIPSVLHSRQSLLIYTFLPAFSRFLQWPVSMRARVLMQAETQVRDLKTL